MNHVYVAETLDAATWGAELAVGDGPGRIYIVEATGPLEDDPNVTDKRFPGNPTPTTDRNGRHPPVRECRCDRRRPLKSINARLTAQVTGST